MAKTRRRGLRLRPPERGPSFGPLAAPEVSRGFHPESCGQSKRGKPSRVWGRTVRAKVLVLSARWLESGSCQKEKKKKFDKKRWSVCLFQPPLLPASGGPSPGQLRWSLSYSLDVFVPVSSKHTQDPCFPTITSASRIWALMGVSGPLPSGQGPLKNGQFSKHGMACVGAAAHRHFSFDSFALSHD